MIKRTLYPVWSHTLLTRIRSKGLLAVSHSHPFSEDKDWTCLRNNEKLCTCMPAAGAEYMPLL